MYLVKETFIASNGDVYNEGDELTGKEYEALSADDRSKIKWYDDDDEEGDDFTGYNDAEKVDEE